MFHLAGFSQGVSLKIAWKRVGFSYVQADALSRYSNRAGKHSYRPQKPLDRPLYPFPNGGGSSFKGGFTRSRKVQFSNDGATPFRDEGRSAGFAGIFRPTGASGWSPDRLSGIQRGDPWSPEKRFGLFEAGNSSSETGRHLHGFCGRFRRVELPDATSLDDSGSGRCPDSGRPTGFEG